MNEYLKNLLIVFGSLIGFILFMVLLFSPLAYISYLDEKAHDEACEKIGFKSHVQNMGQDYCEDHNYNLHYAKIINTGNTFGFKYKAVKISIGDVRTKHNDALLGADE